MAEPCIILWRNTSRHTTGTSIFAITDEDSERLAVFPSHDEAMAFASASPLLRAMPFQVVELVEVAP